MRARNTYLLPELTFDRLGEIERGPSSTKNQGPRKISPEWTCSAA